MRLRGKWLQAERHRTLGGFGLATARSDQFNAFREGKKPLRPGSARLLAGTVRSLRRDNGTQAPLLAFQALVPRTMGD
jgi:hypothetical protein